ncbi:MAG: DUF445 family protein [Firmicutes bacterium]|nr:DUF445 family protein [Bacillota bacterium]
MIFLFLPLIGAFIGLITNMMAIRLLFRPLEPFKLVPLVTFQGLIPKRREQIADAVGQVVAGQLFSVSELTAQLNISELQREADRAVRKAVEEWCQGKMGLLPEGLRQYFSNYLRDTVAAEVAARFPAIAGIMLTRMQEQVDVRQIVSDKIKALPLAEVEGLVMVVARRELRQIEWLGAVLGFVIGLLQALLVYFWV